MFLRESKIYSYLYEVYLNNHIVRTQDIYSHSSVPCVIGFSSVISHKGHYFCFLS